MSRVFIAVGSNIEPEKNIRNALKLLARQFSVAGISTFYRTPAEGRPEQPPFVNGVVEIETDLHPADLQELLRRIETKLGRKRTADKFASRTIDLDIVSDEEMGRPFVAVPLGELAPDLAPEAIQTADMEALPKLTEELRKDGLRED